MKVGDLEDTTVNLPLCFNTPDYQCTLTVHQEVLLAGDDQGWSWMIDHTKQSDVHSCK